MSAERQYSNAAAGGARNEARTSCFAWGTVKPHPRSFAFNSLSVVALSSISGIVAATRDLASASVQGGSLTDIVRQPTAPSMPSSRTFIAIEIRSADNFMILHRENDLCLVKSNN